jgi:predicted nuclease of predicted toxin-antitoxin system
MPRTIRSHLDEHVPHAVADGLRRLGIDVTTSTEAGLLGSTDEDQLAFGLQQGRVVFAQDPDCLALSAKGIEHAGIAYCEQTARSMGQIIRGLELIWEIYEPDEMKNRVEFI